jgi:D-sedoheptulose 7-phosphate isomerase
VNMSSVAKNYIQTVRLALAQIDLEALDQVVDCIWECYLNQGTIYTFGNGGSSTTASHFSGDIVKGLTLNDKPRFKSICLSDNQAGLMAIANDVDYSSIFIEPLKNFLLSHDIVIGFSGSGNSPNVIKAIDYAHKRNINTIGFCGFSGGKLKDKVKHNLHIQINDMEVAEDCHLILAHTIKKELMERLLLHS